MDQTKPTLNDVEPTPSKMQQSYLDRVKAVADSHREAIQRRSDFLSMKDIEL